MTDHYMKLSYWNVSKNIYYSILFIIPMLFLYEIMCWYQFINLDFQIRNGADAFLRQLFLNTGQHAEIVYALSLLVIFIIIIVLNKNIIITGNLKINYLLWMFFESFIWSVIFILLMKSYALNILSIFSQNILPSQIYLAIGAGIWEEFLFRVIILGVSINFMKYILGFNYLFSAFISIAISGIIFSLFHYIGQLGDIFTFRVFSFRAFAGIILGTLYLMRGFGITVYTHIFYDIAIITQPQIININ